MSIGQWIILRLFRKHACKSLKVHRYVELTIEVYKEKERLCSPLGTSYFGFKAFFRRGLRKSLVDDHVGIRKTPYTVFENLMGIHDF